MRTLGLMSYTSICLCFEVVCGHLKFIVNNLMSVTVASARKSVYMYVFTLLTGETEPRLIFVACDRQDGLM
jgi:hypothetical protein